MSSGGTVGKRVGVVLRATGKVTGKPARRERLPPMHDEGFAGTGLEDLDRGSVGQVGEHRVGGGHGIAQEGSERRDQQPGPDRPAHRSLDHGAGAVRAGHEPGRAR